MSWILLYIAGGMLSTMIAYQVGWAESGIDQAVEYFNQVGVNSSLQAKQIMGAAFVYFAWLVLYPFFWLEVIVTFVWSLLKP